MKNKSNNKHNYDNHNYNTRTNDNALTTFSRLSKSLNSHTVLSLKIYNKLKTAIAKYQIMQFKNKCFNWQEEHAFYILDDVLLLIP